MTRGREPGRKQDSRRGGIGATPSRRNPECDEGVLTNEEYRVESFHGNPYCVDNSPGGRRRSASQSADPANERAATSTRATPFAFIANPVMLIRSPQRSEGIALRFESPR